MKGVTGIAVAPQPGMDRTMATPGQSLRLKHHVGCPLAQVQSCTCLVERTAPLLIENHQRTEAIEVEHREGFRTACHHDVGLTRLQQTGAEAKGIGSRRTGGGDGCIFAEQAEIVGYQTGIAATAMVFHARQVLVALLDVVEEALRHVHPCHGGARDQHDAQGGTADEAGINLGIAQGLAHSRHPQEGRTAHGLTGTEAKHVSQFLIRMLHLAHGQFVVRRAQMAHLPDARTPLAQGFQYRRLVVADGTDDAFPRDCDIHAPVCCKSYFVRCFAT